jgi:hypothetical protein
MPLPRIELRTPFARAVVPVAAGIAFFAVLGLILFGVAHLISRNPEQVEGLGDRRFQVGNVERIADLIDDDGPILFPGLNTMTGDRTIVLEHEGDIPQEGWRVFYAYPADRDRECTVEQVRGTDQFTDCEGRTLAVTDLAPPPGVFPIVEDRKTLFIDLRSADDPSATVVPAATTG